MKIKVVKKASSKRPQGYCEVWIDDPPMTKR
jgi:hypothetical protein